MEISNKPWTLSLLYAEFQTLHFIIEFINIYMESNFFVIIKFLQIKQDRFEEKRTPGHQSKILENSLTNQIYDPDNVILIDATKVKTISNSF